MNTFYKTVFVLIFIAASCIRNAKAQTAPGIEWQRTIGGGSQDLLFTMSKTADNGIIVGGFSSSDSSGDKTENSMGGRDYWLLKIDSSGNIVWQNTIGGDQEDQLYSVSPTMDGGYICGGGSRSNISGDKTENNCYNFLGNFDYWVVKLDAAGTIEWQSTFGGNQNDWLYSIVQTSDGGYICGGESMTSLMSCDKLDGSWGNNDYWIVKLDAVGNIEWQNLLGGTEYDRFVSISETHDGGYICGGSSNSNISGDKTANSKGGGDFWILKLNTLGNIEWQKTIGGSDEDRLSIITPTPDGGYICGSSSSSNISGDKTENNHDSTLDTYDYWVVKLDSIGNIVWQNTIGGNGNDYLNLIVRTSNGGYICGGGSRSNASGDKTGLNNDTTLYSEDFWVVKIDSIGNIEWEKTIGGSSSDAIYSICQISDSSYICAGVSVSNISGDKTENSINGSFDYWIVKLFPETTTGISDSETKIPGLKISPNPVINQSRITFSNNNKQEFIFTLTDITGRITETASTNGSSITIIKDSKPAGVYLFTLTNQKTGERSNGKIVVQ